MGLNEVDYMVQITVGFVVILSLVIIFPALLPSKSEGFASNVGLYPTQQLCSAPLTTPSPEMPGPAPATLSEPRDPYNLLSDYMAPAEDNKVCALTSQEAYEVDGQRRIELTGSYGQVTNNYRHKSPGNRTTWLNELSLSFYNNPPQ